MKRRKIGTMDLILIIIFVSLAIFTGIMIKTFYDVGAVPDTLITCVFAALGGECGVMGWIKTTKERRREREWEVQDRKREEERNEQEQINHLYTIDEETESSEKSCD